MKNIIILAILFFITNSNSQNKIEKIEFVSEGYASAPDFDLIIYSDRIAIFNARSDNYKIHPNGNIVGYGIDNKGVNIKESEIKGIFATKIKAKIYKEILNLIFALSEEFENKSFNSNTLHNSIGKLKVTYKTGKVKLIYDNGMNGTNDLLKLYSYMKDLRFNQKWK